MPTKHPMQPIVLVSRIARFKKNPIVEYLLDRGGIDMNDIAIAIANGRLKATKDDQAHFAQLIGYSVSGWGDLSYVGKKDIAAADAIVDAMLTEGKQP